MYNLVLKNGMLIICPKRAQAFFAAHGEQIVATGLDLIHAVDRRYKQEASSCRRKAIKNPVARPQGMKKRKSLNWVSNAHLSGLLCHRLRVSFS